MPDFSDAAIAQLPDGEATPGVPQDAPTWGDYGSAVMTGLYGLQSATESGIAILQGNHDDEAHWDAAARVSRDKTGDTIAGMTQSGRDRLNASVTSGEFWDHPMSSALLKGSQMAPAMVAQTLGGLMGGVPGIVATGASGAALNAAQLRDAVMDNLDKAPDKTLREKNQTYDTLRQHMTPDDAKEMLGDKILNGDGYLMLAGIAGAVGAAGGLGGLIARGGVAGGAITRAGLGALEGGGAAAFQGGVTDAAQQSALQAAGAQDTFDKDEWFANVLEQLFPSAIGGGAHSLLHGAHVDDPTKTPQLGNDGRGQAAAPIPDVGSTQAKPGVAEGGRATVTRSARAYPKTGAETTPLVSSPAPSEPSAAALPTADPAVKEALAPKPVPKPVEPPAPKVTVAPAPAPAVEPTPPVTPVGNPPPAPVDSGILQAGPHPLADQHAALTAGARSAVLYREDQPPLPLPGGMKQTKIKQGIVQWNPEQISRQKISQALRDGTFDRVSAPTPTPEPVATTVPDATVAPPSPPSSTMKASPSGILASPTNPSTAIVTTTAAGPPRVLEDTSKTAKANAKKSDSIVAKNLKATEDVAPVAGSKAGKDAIAARAANNEAAESVIRNHLPKPEEASAVDPTQPGGVGARGALLTRVKAMLEEARDTGVVIPDMLKDNANPDMAHSPALTILKEAQALTRTKVPTTPQYQRFVTREYAVLSGADNEVKSDRRAEGDASKQQHIAEGGEESGAAGVVESHEDETLDRLDAEKADKARAKSSLPQLNDKLIEKRLKESANKIRTVLLSGKGNLPISEREVNIPDLVSQQDWIESARKEPALATGELPVVVSIGGNLVVRDGNHRIAALIDRGDRVVKARVVEVDPYPSAERESGYSAFNEAKKPPVVIAAKGREAIKARIQAARAATETNPTEAEKAAGNYPKGKLTFEGSPITIENPKGSIREGESNPLPARHVWDMRPLGKGVMGGEPGGFQSKMNELRTWANSLSDAEYAHMQKVFGSDWPGHLSGSMEPERFLEQAKESLAGGLIAPSGKKWSVEMPGDYGYIRGTKGADGDHVDTLIGDKGETGKAFVVNQKDPKTGDFDEHKVIQGVNTETEAKALYNKSFSDGSGPDRMASIGPPNAQSRRILDEINRIRSKAPGAPPALPPREPSIVELPKDHLNEWLRNPTATRQPLSDIPNEVVTTKGNFEPIETTNVHDLLTAMAPRGSGVTGSKLIPFMASRLKELAGDVPVHWVDADTIQRLWGRAGEPGGMYMTRDRIILLNAEMPAGEHTHVMMHEAVHAALAHALEKNPDFKPQIRMLMDLFAERNPGINKYALKNEHEFLAEILSDPAMQDIANKTVLSSQLANALGLPQFRAASLWSGLVALARRVLRLPPSAATVMEGAMAIAEKLSWDKQPIKALQFGARLGKAHEEGRITEFASMRDTTRGLTEPTEEGKERLSAVTLAGNLATKLLSAAPASETMHEMGVKLQTNDQLRQGNEKYFGALDENNPMRIVTDTMEKMGVRQKQYLEPANKLAKDLAVARVKYEGDKGWDKMAGLISDMSTHNLHADSPLDSNANRHLRLPKSAKTEDEGATRVWQSRAKHPELAATYNSLPDELQRLVGRLGEYYRSEHVERSKAVLTGILDAHEPTPGSTMDEVIDRAINGKLTDEDEEHYEQFGIGKALKGAMEFQKPQGFYAPKKRFGEYVASGEHEVTIPSNATKIDDRTMEFGSREEAHDYVAKADLPASVEIRHYDPTTGERVRADEAISSGPPPVTKYRVSVENSHLEFSDTVKQAKAVRQAMIDAGIKNVKDLDRRKLNKEVDYSLSSPQMQALIKGVERREDLSRAQKDVLIRSMTESSITMRAGNRLEPHFLKTRNVRGESADVVRTLTNYSHASAAYRARGDFAPIVDNAMKDMATTLESNRYDGNTFQRRVAHQELEQRIYGSSAPEYGAWGSLAPFWQKVMAISFWKRMMSPAHLLLHMTHPGMISGPVLGSRHGFGQAYRELYRSYRDMGGAVPALGLGAKGLVNVFKEDSDPTNFLDYFKRKLATAKDGRAVLNMIGELEETGHIHPNQGFEVGHFAETATKTQRVMERVDRAFREMTSSTESINRVAESVAAYRLELRKNGGDHEAAVRYAKDTLANTQGLYSVTNAAPLFRNQVLRPFLQFKQFPQMIYHLLAKNLYTTLNKTEDKAVRIQAAKAFAGVVATHAAMAGVMGLPLEVIKAPVMLANALELTNTNWQDIEDNTQEEMARLFGPQLGEIVSNGLSRALGPASVDVHHRLGLGSLLTFGEPESGKSSDTLNWMLDTLAGAPGSMLTDYLDASHAALNGDWEGAFEKANPIKALADLSKAARLGVYGKPTTSGKPGMAPLGPAQTIVTGLGFKSGDAAQYDTARWASEKAEKALSQEKATLVGNWTKATGGAARAKAMQSISAYNARVPVDQRISDKHMQAAAKAQQGTYELGQRVTPRNKALLDNYNELYNVR